MSRTREPFYHPPTNGDAMRRARREKGLQEEIAMLRVKLKEWVAQHEPDEGLILSAVNTLGRALMAQARIQGGDPEQAGGLLAAAMQQLGVILKGVESERNAVPGDAAPAIDGKSEAVQGDER